MEFRLAIKDFSTNVLPKMTSQNVIYAKLMMWKLTGSPNLETDKH